MLFSPFYFLVANLLLFSVIGEEITIHLPTSQEKKYAIYLAPLEPFASPYEQAIREIVEKDLLHLGKALFKKVDTNLQKDVHHPNPSIAFQSNRWRSFGVQFVILPKIENRSLSISLFDVYASLLKTLPPIPLSNNLKKDTHHIHRLSDLLCKIIFKEQGIASKRILYSRQTNPSSRDVWQSEIWEMAYDGNNQRQITKEDAYSITPVFIPKTNPSENYTFLYVTYKQGPPRIYLSSREGYKGKPIVPLRGNQLLPAISSNLDKIAFISDASGRADLFIQPFHPEKGVYGKPLQLYTFPNSVQASPSFHPDGTKLVFVSDKTGRPNIYSIDLPTSSQPSKTPSLTLLSKIATNGTTPAWSPDGTKIAFSAKTHGVQQIWLYDLEKEEEKQLTSGEENKENPSWAPNSKHLVYNTTSPSYDIYLIHLDHPKPIRLTEGDGIKHYPVFEP